MSKNYKALPVNMRDHLKELTPAELKVWLYLHLRTGKEGTAFPSNDTIAKETDLSLGTVKTAKRGLRRKGWTSKEEQRVRADGTFSTVVEKTHLPWVKNCTAEGQNLAHGTVVQKTDGGKLTQQKEYTSSFEVPEPSAPIQENLEGSVLTDGDSKTDSEKPSTPVRSFSQTAKNLLNMIQPIRDEGNDSGDLALVDEILKYIPENINPIYLLQYNHWHKKGGLYVRSAEQFRNAVQGKDGDYHLLNEYWNHDPQACRDCKAHGITASAQQIWARKQEREAEAAWRKAEQLREAALAQYEFREPSNDELTQFKSLRGDGWEDGTLKKLVVDGTWDRRHVDAAILYQLKLGTPASFEAFTCLVESIRDLDTPAPTANQMAAAPACI